MASQPSSVLSSPRCEPAFFTCPLTSVTTAPGPGPLPRPGCRSLSPSRPRASYRFAHPVTPGPLSCPPTHALLRTLGLPRGLLLSRCRGSPPTCQPSSGLWLSSVPLFSWEARGLTRPGFASPFWAPLLGCLIPRPSGWGCLDGSVEGASWRLLGSVQGSGCPVSLGRTLPWHV